MPTQLSPEEQKEMFKQAMKEWIDDKYILLGKFTLGMLATLGLGAFTYFVLSMSGWRHG